MKIGRRHLLFTGAALVASRGHCASGQTSNRCSQDQLDEAILLHGQWVADPDTGRRAVFAGCNFSGLRFRAPDDGPVHLDGADFTQADLSETEADDLRAYRCAFNGARLDGSCWRRPTLAFSDLRRVSAKSVEWGVRVSPEPLEWPLADLSHAAFHDADLSQADICGYFYATKMVRTRLVQADLSFSKIAGIASHCEASFSEADLTDADLSDCQISLASFWKADCTGTDFTRSVFLQMRLKDCDFKQARF